METSAPRWSTIGVWAVLWLCVPRGGGDPAPPRPKAGAFWRWLNCEHDPEWTALRVQTCAYRERGFPVDEKLWDFAASLLERKGRLVDNARFIAAMWDPAVGHFHPDDCGYGKVTALFLYGIRLLSLTLLNDAGKEWNWAMNVLGIAHAADILEATDWCVRSADILCARTTFTIVWTVAPVALVSVQPPEVSHMGYSENVLRGVDTNCAVWSCRDPLPVWPVEPLKGAALQVAVFGDHLALAEPTAVLLLGRHGQTPLLKVQTTWHGLSAHAQQVIATATKQPLLVAPGLNYSRSGRTVFSPEDMELVMDEYRRYTEQLQEAPDLVIALGVRDSFHLWQIARRPTLHLSATYWLIDGKSEYSYQELLKQIQSFFNNDVLQLGDHFDSELPPTASIALTTYSAEWFLDPLGIRLPAVRQLALYMLPFVQPNATNRRIELLVVPGKVTTLRYKIYLGALREARRVFSARGRLNIVLPLTAGKGTLGGMQYQDLSRFHAVAFFQWLGGVTLFRELYAISLPIFLPDIYWLARLWSYELQASYHRPWAFQKPVHTHEHPMPPVELSFDHWSSMLYWVRWYDDSWRLPGVLKFASFAELFLPLLQGHVDLSAVSQSMRAENTRALEEVGPFWVSVFTRLVNTSTG